MATVLERSKLVAAPRKAGQWNGLATGVYTLWLKHMLKFVSSSMEVTGTLGLPILWMFFFGLAMHGMVNEMRSMNINIDYISFITPGIIMLTALTAAILGGSTLLMERVNGVIKEYMVAPIPRLAVLLGTMSSAITKAVLQSLIILALGTVLGGGLNWNPLTLLAGLALTVVYALGFVGIAAALASVAKGMESYHAIIMIFNLPLLFTSNALYPMTELPAFIKVLCYLNPTTYAVDATRQLFFNGTSEIGILIDIPVLLVFSVVCVWFGYRTFQRAVANPA
jgi:ABC-2 type transport system permease protein